MIKKLYSVCVTAKNVEGEKAIISSWPIVVFAENSDEAKTLGNNWLCGFSHEHISAEITPFEIPHDLVLKYIEQFIL